MEIKLEIEEIANEKKIEMISFDKLKIDSDYEKDYETDYETNSESNLKVNDPEESRKWIDSIPNEKKSRACIGITLVIFFCIFACSWISISKGIDYHETVTTNQYKCTVLNITVEIKEGDIIYYLGTWLISYENEKNRGIYTIKEETVKTLKMNEWKEGFRIGDSESCTLFFTSDTSFYFTWTENVDLQQMRTNLILVTIMDVFFILGLYFSIVCVYVSYKSRCTRRRK